ncbi:MAG: hypothetical protein NC413_00820, partial [Muribaculum sp.]|nr:hypothetical protein [Muribaculum sp.]
MSIAKQTSPKGANAHGHYTLFTSNNSIPLSTKLLADPVYLQIHPSQTVGFRRLPFPKIPEIYYRQAARHQAFHQTGLAVPPTTMHLWLIPLTASKELP